MNEVKMRWYEMTMKRKRWSRVNTRDTRPRVAGLSAFGASYKIITLVSNRVPIYITLAFSTRYIRFAMRAQNNWHSILLSFRFSCFCQVSWLPVTIYYQQSKEWTLKHDWFISDVTLGWLPFKLSIFTVSFQIRLIKLFPYPLHFRPNLLCYSHSYGSDQGPYIF